MSKLEPESRMPKLALPLAAGIALALVLMIVLQRGRAADPPPASATAPIEAAAPEGDPPREALAASPKALAAGEPEAIGAIAASTTAQTFRYRGRVKGEPRWFELEHPAGWHVDRGATGPGPILQSIPFDPVPRAAAWARLQIDMTGRAWQARESSELIEIAGRPARRQSAVSDWGQWTMQQRFDDPEANYVLDASVTSADGADGAEALAQREALLQVAGSLRPIEWRVDQSAFVESRLDSAFGQGQGLRLTHPAGWTIDLEGGEVRLSGAVDADGAAGQAPVELRIARAGELAAAWESADALEFGVLGRPARRVAEPSQGLEPGDERYLLGPDAAWQVRVSGPSFEPGSEAELLGSQLVWAVLTGSQLFASGAAYP